MHLKQDHRDKTNLVCKDCDLSYQKEFDLRLHISMKHPEKQPSFSFTKMKITKTNPLAKMTYSKEY